MIHTFITFTIRVCPRDGCVGMQVRRQKRSNLANGKPVMVADHLLIHFTLQHLSSQPSSCTYLAQLGMTSPRFLAVKGILRRMCRFRRRLGVLFNQYSSKCGENDFIARSRPLFLSVCTTSCIQSWPVRPTSETIPIVYSLGGRHMHTAFRLCEQSPNNSTLRRAT
jgi:hypothetical protein